ncbi:MAG: DNA alkylation repair protein [Fermentimonas sp.]|nr:DNA alkylation repair protein [Fermentimonas sp.]
MSAIEIKNKLIAFGNPEKAHHSSYFFKTAKGQYGYGDMFIGCTVPETRSVAKQYPELPLSENKKLLDDEMHECRLCALVILTEQFKKASEIAKYEILNFYLAHTNRINNWDLVDASSYKIVGEWLKNREDRSLLYRLADSELLWDQRIAIVSTLTFIRNNDFNDILKLSEKFLTHKHDLIHKACGWMLREAGKRDEAVLTDFLDEYNTQMPRTMLIYSIEILPEDLRKYYLNHKKNKKEE